MKPHSRPWIKLCFIAFLATLFFTEAAYATTWAPKTKRCPVCGHKVSGRVPASWGSYVYRWPSKVHLIFWPRTARQFFWMCPKCGYAAMLSDFSKLTPKNKKKMKTQVQSKWRRPKNITFKLKMLQAKKCYGLRDKKIKFWIEYYRTLALNFEKIDKKQAARFRKKALGLRKKRLKKPNHKQAKQKALHYLIGEYLRSKKKKKKAKKHLETAKKTLWKKKGKANKGANKYIDDLIDESLKKLKRK